MKYCLVVVSILFLALSAQAEDYDLPKGELTLEKAISITLSRNPGIAQAQERINQAKALLTQARSAWLPRISVQGSAMAQQATVQPDWRPNLRISEALNDYQAGIQGTFLLFDGFAREFRIMGAAHGVSQSKYMKENTRRMLIRAVSLTYYQVRIAMEKMVIARQDQEFNRILENHARIRCEAGVSPESEVLNFSVRALTAATNFADARNQFETTCITLGQLMGIKKPELTPAHIPARKDSVISLNLPDPEKEIAFAVEHRPDIKALDMGIAAVKKQYQAARAKFFPKLALVSGVKYEYQDEKANIDEEEHQAYAGASLQWELYTGGQRKGEIVQAYARLQEVTQQRKQLILSLRSDIHSAVVSANTAWNNWNNRKQIALMANTIRDHVQKAYKAGKASLARMNQAQSDYIKAKSAASTGKLAYLAALVELSAASGRNLHGQEM